MDYDGMKIVQFGDYIALYSECELGYVAANSTSELDNQPIVYSNQSYNNPECVDTMSMLLFEVCMVHRYKMNKRYRRMLESDESKVENLENIEKLKKFKEAASIEERDNEQVTRRNFGRKLRFGDIIQLRHVFSGYFVHINSNQLSEIQKSAFKTMLKPYSAKSAQFQIVPKYKVDMDGSEVAVGSYISLESMASRSYFFHTNINPAFPPTSSKPGFSELNVSLEKHGFVIYKSRTKDQPTKGYLSGLDIIHFFHQEAEAYFTAEGYYSGKVTEKLHMRLRKIDLLDIRTLTPSTNSNTYWEIEKADEPYSTDAISWNEPVRIKHGSTRLYLSINSKNQLILSNNIHDPLTVFKFHPVNKDKEICIRKGINVRVENIRTNIWLKVIPDEPYKKLEGSKSSRYPSLIEWDNAELVSVTMNEHQQYDDAFNLEEVASTNVDIFHKACGFMTLIFNLRNTIKDYQLVTDESLITYYSAVLMEITNFISPCGRKPIKNRQKLMRCTKMIDIIFNVIESYGKLSMSSQQRWVKPFKLLFHLVSNYIGGNKKNTEYIGRYFTLFTESSWKTSPMVTEVISILTLMLSSSSALADQIQQSHIQSVLQLVRDNSHPVFLRFLAQTCISKDVPIISNQDYMINEWLIRDKTGLYIMKSGREIGLEGDKYYVSTDLGKTWFTIQEFYNPHSRRYNEGSCQFLLAQLNFFKALTHGRNIMGIRVISEDERYVTWPMVLFCLKDNSLPDDFRASLCKLVINLFMTYGNNFMILEYPRYNFNFHELDHDLSRKLPAIPQAYSTNNRTTDCLDASMLDLYDWILRFIIQNGSVVNNCIPRNRLLLEVLTLVKNLIHYGYFTNSHSLMVLVNPILNFLDGRNDVKFTQVLNGRGLTMQERDEQQYYHYEGRFEVLSEASRVIMDAKEAGLNVLDQILKFQLNHRTLNILQLFKYSTDQLESLSKREVAFFNALFSENDNMDKLRMYKKEFGAFKERIEEAMFSEMYFDMDRVKDVMLDLAQYKHDPLLHKSLFFLFKFFSSENSVFEVCQNVMIASHEQSQIWMKMVEESVLQLEILVNNDWTSQTVKDFADIVKTIRAYSTLPNSTEPNLIFQKIIYSSNLVYVLLKVFEKETGVFKAVLAKDKTNNSTVFRRISKIRPENFTHVHHIYREALDCLCSITKEMSGIQNILFKKLNLITSLGDTGCLRRKLKLLKAIFADREDLVEHISGDLIELLFEWLLTFKEYRAELIDLIICLGKVQDKGTLVRENMISIIKLVMKNWTELGALMDSSTEEKIDVLNQIDDGPEKSFLIRLVYLLACGSELDLEYVESFCKTVLNIEDILIIIGKVDDLVVQRSYLKFLCNVYIRTETLSSECDYITTDISIVLKSKVFWRVIEVIRDQNNPWVEKLKSMSSNEIYEGLLVIRDQESLVSDETRYLAWLMDGVVPFLKEVIRNRSNKVDTAPENQVMIETVRSVLASLYEVAPHFASFHQVRVVTNYLFSAVLSNYVRYQTLEPTYARLGVSIRHAGPEEYSNVRHELLQRHREEQELNFQFRRFIKKCMRLHQGENSVSVQIAYPSVVPGIEKTMKDKNKRSEIYTTSGDVEELPLGSEFQALMTTFMKLDDDRPEKRFKTLKCIIRHLKMPLPRMMGRPGESRRKHAADQDYVNMFCFKILRGILHNEISRLPTNWPLYMHDYYVIGQLQFIRQIQSIMCDLDLFESSLHHAARIDSPVTMELFAFLKVLFFNSSTYVQHTIFRFFIVSVTETFFFAIKEYLTIFESNVKTLRRKTNATVKDKHRESTQFLVRRNTLTKMENLEDFDVDLTMYFECREYFQQVEEAKLKLLDNVTPIKFDTMIENGFGVLLMKVLQSLCEGQFVLLQDYMRVQEDNPKSFNLVFRTCSMIGTIYAHINDVTIDIVTQLFGAINQMTIGNHENRLTLINGKVADYINSIMRTTEFKDCTPTQVLNLRDIVVTLLLNLIEENSPEAQEMAREIMITLDKKSILNIILHYHQLSKPDVMPDLTSLVSSSQVHIPQSQIGSITQKLFPVLQSHKLKKISQIRERIFSIGYKHTAVLLRFNDLDPVYIKDYLQAKKDGQISLELASSNSPQAETSNPANVNTPNPSTTTNKDNNNNNTNNNNTNDNNGENNKVNNNSTSNTSGNSAPTTSASVYSDEITPAHIGAFKNFKKAGRSIEVIKDNTLQRIHFRVKNPKVIREDLIETIKWDVDRTSAASKIRDFAEWSSSVIQDLENSKNSSSLKNFLIQSWYLWNYLPVLLSLVINIIMLITFKSAYSLTRGAKFNATLHDPFPRLRDSPKLDTHLSYLSCIHTMFSFTLMVTYFLIAKPGFNNVRELWAIIKSKFIRFPPSESILMRQEQNRAKKARRKIDMLTENEKAESNIDYRKLKTILDTKPNENLGETEQVENENEVHEKTLNANNENEEEILSQHQTNNNSRNTAFAMLNNKKKHSKRHHPICSNKLTNHFFSFRTLYYIMFFLFSLAGTIIGGIMYKTTNNEKYMIAYFLFAFHMINVAVIVNDLKGVFIAVSQSLRPMTWVGLLILVILYSFNVVLFVFFRDSTKMEDNLYCSNLGYCYLTLIRFGFIFDKWFELFLPHFNVKENFVNYLYLAIFTIALYIIVTIIMLNIIAGIIVDKFASTRNLKNSKFDDMSSLCFICGRSSYEFETMAKGFRYHIMTEHNMWSYLYFLISLQTMKIADFSALQWHVHHMFQNKNFEFFPTDRALALSEIEKETEEHKLDEASVILEDIVGNMERLKTQREVQARRNRLEMWRHDSMDNNGTISQQQDVDNSLNQSTSQHLGRSQIGNSLVQALSAVQRNNNAYPGSGSFDNSHLMLPQESNQFTPSTNINTIPVNLISFDNHQSNQPVSRRSTDTTGRRSSRSSNQ